MTLVIVGIASLAMASCMAPYPLYQRVSPPSPTTPSDMVLSPDGRTVAFSARKRGIGLYDWRTGQVRYFPVPSGYENILWPSFSPDGSKLAISGHLLRKDNKQVVRETRLGLIELATGKITFFEVSGSKPAFAPDGKSIAYLDPYWKRCSLFDPETQTSRMVLAEEDGFFDSIWHQSFIADDTILFAASRPRDPKLKEAVDTAFTKSAPPTAHTLQASSGQVPYVLRIGSKPEIAPLARQFFARLHQLPDSMSASRNGQRVAFITSSVPARNSPELYVLENKQVRQVTQLGTYIRHVVISQNGSTAAFAIKNSDASQLTFDLAIVDLDTGQVTRTDFVRRVYDGVSD